MEHAELKERLEAYALGALEAEEAEEVAIHLLSCTECQAELNTYRRVADSLPSALAAGSPLRVHPSLKRKVLAGLQAPTRTRRRFRAGLWPAAAVLAVLMFAASTIWGLHVQQQLSRDELLRSEQLAKMETTLDRNDQLRVLELLDSSARVKRGLKPVDPASPTFQHSYGKLWTRTDGDDVVVMVNLLPQPPPGQHYELIVTSDGRKIDAGTLKVDQDGFAMLLFRADRKGPSYTRATVTLAVTPILDWQQGSN